MDNFIRCTFLAQLPHFSCLFCEAMIGWVYIAIQVNMFCILPPIELVLTIFKKCRVSCYSLFTLGKRKPTMYSKLQEDRKISICNHCFQFWASGLKCGNQLQAPLPKKWWNLKLVFIKLYWQYGFSKMVSLTIRTLKELNLYSLFQFWAN